MPLFTSQRLIQWHAISLFILAYYLITAPEVITTSSMVFMLGEAMHIDPLPSDYIQSQPGIGTSLAICAILLLAEGLVDLILVGKLPQMKEVLAMAEEIQRSHPQPHNIPSSSSSSPLDAIMSGHGRAYGDIPIPISARDNQRANPFMVQLANLYSDIYTVLAAVRFCLYFGVAFFVYQSQSRSPSTQGGWQHTGAGRGRDFVDGPLEGLDQLKNRVVFTYAFVETMFWLWMLLKLREERVLSNVRFVPQEE